MCECASGVLVRARVGVCGGVSIDAVLEKGIKCECLTEWQAFWHSVTSAEIFSLWIYWVTKTQRV